MLAVPVNDTDGVVDIMKTYIDQQKHEVDDRILKLEQTNDKQAACILYLEQRINDLTAHVNAGHEIIFPRLETIENEKSLAHFTCDDLEDALKVFGDRPNTP